MVATKSSNLKGGFVKNLKDAVKSIDATMEVLLTRSAREENLQLERENKRLRNDNKSLKGEIDNLKTEVNELREAIKEVKRGRMNRRPTTIDTDCIPEMSNNTYEEGNNNIMEIEMEEMRTNQPNTRKETVKKGPRPGGESTEHLIGTIMLQVGDMLNARFEALEGRLLSEASFRPKLMESTQTQLSKADRQRKNKEFPNLPVHSLRSEVLF